MHKTVGRDLVNSTCTLIYPFCFCSKLGRIQHCELYVYTVCKDVFDEEIRNWSWHIPHFYQRSEGTDCLC